MPLYEYECAKCGERFEVIQKFSDDLFQVHSEDDGSECDGAVKKLLSAPAIQFKGEGWYVTDYGKGGQKPKKESSEKSSSDSDKSAKSDSSSTKETKSESKSSDTSSKSNGSSSSTKSE